MSEWVCRRCGGGFPYPIVARNEPVCPWCAEPIGKPLAASKAQRERIIRHYDVPSITGGDT